MTASLTVVLSGAFVQRGDIQEVAVEMDDFIQFGVGDDMLHEGPELVGNPRPWGAATVRRATAAFTSCRAFASAMAP